MILSRLKESWPDISIEIDTIQLITSLITIYPTNPPSESTILDGDNTRWAR
jgi:hypothetical protein